MLLNFIRKILLTCLTLLLLSLISYLILQRDPLNDFGLYSGVDGYVHYLQGLLHGNFGISYATGEPIAKQILNVIPATISLCLSASLVSVLLGIPLGLFSATQRDNWIGKFMATLGSLSLAVPIFWLAIVLVYTASIENWEIAGVGEVHPIYQVPSITGFRLLDILLSDSPYRLKMAQSALQHLALPTLILSIPATLEVMNLTQQRAEYVAKQHYVKVAYTRGWSPFKIWRKVLLRNTLPPLLPIIVRNLTLIFTFAMLIENIFSWGGIGRWVINALSVQDYQAISAGVLAIGLFILIVDLLASLISTLLDPSHKKDWYL